jgi:hypothetical protein
MSQEQNLKLIQFTRRQIGTMLIWTGIFVWVPYVVLHLIGQEPKLIIFLPLHLVGVVSGSRLRKVNENNSFENSQAASQPLQKLGRIFILLGALVWVPYFWLDLVMRQTVHLQQYLPFHLAGVFTGLGLLLLNAILKRNRKEVDQWKS